MGLPEDYTEIFVGETIQKEDNEFLLWDNQYRYVTLNYAKEHLIDTNKQTNEKTQNKQSK